MLLRKASLAAGTLVCLTCASLAPAQVSFVSQNRRVNVLACTPPISRSQSASDFSPFNGSESVIGCPSGPFGAASSAQTSSLDTFQISSTQTTQSGGNAGADNAFQVSFDVAQPLLYSFTAMTNQAALHVTFNGPGVAVDISNTTNAVAGVLVPGRYTIVSNLSGVTGFGNSTISATFSALPFNIPWSTQDCGGGSLSGGAYDLLGTIGQPDAALPILTSADGYRITLGYWARDPGTPPCVADVDDGTFTGQPDGGVTIDDLLFYLEVFRLGSASADVDDGTFTGVPDGGVTVDDLLYYLLRFADGC